MIWLWKSSLRVAPWRATVSCLLVLLAAAMPVVTLALTALAVNAVVAVIKDGATGNTGAALYAAAALVLGSFISALLGLMQNHIGAIWASEVKNTMSVRLLESNERTELAQAEETEALDRAQFVLDNGPLKSVESLNSSLGFLSSLVSLVGISGILLSWDPLVALSTLAAPLPMLVLKIFTGRLWWRLESDRTAERRRFDYLRRALLMGEELREVRFLGIGPQLIDQISGIFRTWLSQERRVMLMSSVFSVLALIVSTLLTLVGFSVAVQSAVSRGDIGALVGFIVATGSVQAALNALIGSASTMLANLPYINDVRVCLDATSHPRKVESAVVAELPIEGFTVDVADVAICYPGEQKAVLEHVDLCLAPGKTYALVGGNGAGKSSLARVVAGIQRPVSGSVRFNDHEVIPSSAPHLRGRVGMLFQNPWKYEGNIRDNLELGIPEHLRSETECWRVLGLSGLADQVRSLSGGLNASLGVLFGSGRQLSGGEWQKLGLARALYGDPWLLILDEPTSAMDAGSRRAFWDRCVRGRQGITVISTHDMDLLPWCDLVVTLADGRVQAIEPPKG